MHHAIRAVQLSRAQECCCTARTFYHRSKGSRPCASAKPIWLPKRAFLPHVIKLFLFPFSAQTWSATRTEINKKSTILMGANRQRVAVVVGTKNKLNLHAYSFFANSRVRETYEADWSGCRNARLIQELPLPDRNICFCFSPLPFSLAAV